MIRSNTYVCWVNSQLSKPTRESRMCPTESMLDSMTHPYAGNQSSAWTDSSFFFARPRAALDSGVKIAMGSVSCHADVCYIRSSDFASILAKFASPCVEPTMCWRKSSIFCWCISHHWASWPHLHDRSVKSKIPFESSFDVILTQKLRCNNSLLCLERGYEELKHSHSFFTADFSAPCQAAPDFLPCQCGT